VTYGEDMDVTDRDCDCLDNKIIFVSSATIKQERKQTAKEIFEDLEKHSDYESEDPSDPDLTVIGYKRFTIEKLKKKYLGDVK